MIADQAARRRQRTIRRSLAAARRAACPAARPCGGSACSTTTPANSSSTSMTTSSIGSSRWPVVGIGLEQHARARDRQLEALAAHRLDQHAELQLAAAGDLEGILLGALAAPGSRHCPRPRVAAARAITREVTLSPSRPASGQSLTEKVIARVGGSIGSAGERRRSTSGAQIVSATVVSASPATAMMSPASRLLDRPPLEAAEGQQLGQPRLLDHAAVAAQRLRPAC